MHKTHLSTWKGEKKINITVKYLIKNLFKTTFLTYSKSFLKCKKYTIKININKERLIVRFA